MAGAIFRPCQAKNWDAFRKDQSEEVISSFNYWSGMILLPVIFYMNHFLCFFCVRSSFILVGIYALIKVLVHLFVHL